MENRVLYRKKEQCCGCEACVSVCPKHIIEMKKDEYGFLYPQIKNSLACINCNRCSNVCPVANLDKYEKTPFLNFYSGYLKDKDELVSCASGGLATAIAKEMLSKGAVIYGVVYSKEWDGAEYKRVTSFKELELLKTSKYIQAEKKEVYNDVLQDLKLGRTVVFFGLPCEVAAVKNRCGQYDKKLYTVELICHGPTSSNIQIEYINYFKKKYGKSIKDFSVRYKKDGKWKPFYIHIVFEDNAEFFQNFHDSAFGTAFKYLKRPSCYSCKNKGDVLQGDLMIGDYHYVEKGMQSYNEHGVSSALVHSEKGEELMNQICDVFTVFNISKKGAMSNGSIIKPVARPKYADRYIEVYKKKGIFASHNIPIIRIRYNGKKYKQKIKEKLVRIKRKIIPLSKSM